MDNQQKPALTGVRKRQQIEMTNKKIFIWLAVASVIVSFSIVALQFLVREFIFNQKVINEKSKTNQILVGNIEAAEQLTENVNALIADTNLSSLRTDTSDPETSNLSVILDALPVTGDASGFANSLQSAVFPISGVSIRELSTNSAEGEGLAEGDVVIEVDAHTPAPLPFKAGYNGSYAQVQKSLVDIARVIRPINLTELTIAASEEGRLEVTVAGNTYYLPARTVDVKEEVRKP